MTSSRDVMEYSEAMTETPPQVTDELSARRLDRLGAPAMVELTAVVAAANMAARSNTAHIYAVSNPHKLARLDGIAAITRS
jgi:alkylhydroperoxidase family enzyme